MKKQSELPPTTDDTGPVVLGSVMEETRGIQLAGDEFDIGSVNSREDN